MRPNSNLDSSENLSARIKDKAISIGFDSCGIAPVHFLQKEDDRIRSWVESGYHAGMSYLERNSDKRSNPGLLVEKSRSVIVVLINYYQDNNPGKDTPVFSKYALGKDYHKILKEKLGVLLEYVREQVPGSSGRIFVDSAPVMERSWGVKAGLGWIGKNSMLISKKHGSFTFIGELITDAELDYDKPVQMGYCGSCTRCIDACPTKAILPNRSIDSNRCISYLTIEHKEDIPEAFSGMFANNIFGCDICQDVCPWNSKVKQTSVEDFLVKPEIQNGTFSTWNDMSEENFVRIFSDSPLMRTGCSGFKRNLKFVIKDKL